MLLFLFFIFIVIILIIAYGKSPKTIQDDWRTFLDGFQVSTTDFYASMKAALSERQITKVEVTEESFLESHMLSAKRLYLRITQNEYVIYICSAPYGTGTFISFWLCTKDENFLNRIPIVSKLMGKDRDSKTFYQMDTEAMFKLAVHSALTETIGSLTDAKGYRGLTELEKQFKAS